MYLRQLFRILFRTLNHQYDYTFDWTMLKQKATAQSASSSNLIAGIPTASAPPPIPTSTNQGMLGTSAKTPASPAMLATADDLKRERMKFEKDLIKKI